jgi:hypothetical protein
MGFSYYIFLWAVDSHVRLKSVFWELASSWKRDGEGR